MAAPGGRVEDGVKWLALNVRDFTVAQWEATQIIPRARMWDIEIIPWGRLCHPELGENLTTIRQQLTNLVNVGRRWGSKWILPNYENEVDVFSPAQVKAELDKLNWEGKTGWSTLGWLSNGADYSPINDDPVLLQIFPEDMNWGNSAAMIKEKTGHCVWHARVDKGFDYVGTTYQTYRSETDWFTLNGTHSLYPGDGLSSRQAWPIWLPPYGS